MTFEQYTRELQALRSEITQTVLALRQLEGQSGGALGPSANTRSGYVNGVAQSNAIARVGSSSGVGMPLAIAAASAAAGGSNAGIAASLKELEQVKREYASAVAATNRRPALPYSAPSPAIPSIRTPTQLSFGPSGAPLMIPPKRVPRGMPGTENLMVGGPPGGTPVVEVQRIEMFGPKTGTAGEVLRGERRMGEQILNTEGKVHALFGGTPVTGSKYGKITRHRGFNVPGAADAGLNLENRSLKWIGRGMAAGQLIQAWNRLEEEGRMPKAADSSGPWSLTAKQIGATLQEAAPEMAHWMAMGVYSQSFSGAMEIMGGRGPGVFGSTLGKGKSLQMTMGQRAATAKAMGARGISAFAGTTMAMLSNIGVGVLVATAANATGDVIKGAVGLYDPEGFQADNRAQARTIAKLEMMERVRRNLPSRQGVTIQAERLIKDTADRIGSRGGYQEFFGSSDSAFRRFFSWVPFSGVKNEEELRKEAMEELVKKQERIDQHKSKAWEFMRINAYDKAKYHFQETWNQSPEKGRVAAWKDPQRIYQIVQAARVTSRHYAASFQTRNRERTGD